MTDEQNEALAKINRDLVEGRINHEEHRYRALAVITPEPAEETYGGHTAGEVVDLLDMLARAAYRGECNSQDEIRAIAIKGRDALRDALGMT